jgi:hypothetical protein
MKDAGGNQVLGARPGDKSLTERPVSAANFRAASQTSMSTSSVIFVLLIGSRSHDWCGVRDLNPYGLPANGS